MLDRPRPQNSEWQCSIPAVLLALCGCLGNCRCCSEGLMSKCSAGPVQRPGQRILFARLRSSTLCSNAESILTSSCRKAGREGPCSSCESTATAQPLGAVLSRTATVLGVYKASGQCPAQLTTPTRVQTCAELTLAASTPTHVRDGENTIRSGRIYHPSGYATTFWRLIPPLRGTSARG